MSEEVPIEINRRIFDYDLVLIVGPVFPHEVVGFSGGAKYLFPGISGGEFLHFFHWLGAVITCKKIIGIKDTPVRRVIDRAMEMVAVPVHLPGHGGQPRDGPVRAVRGAGPRGLVAGGGPVRPHPHRDQAEALQAGPGCSARACTTRSGPRAR
ncbi:MAG: lactate racemase domain-containing protein [Desulfobacterales bacterium]|nr:lactate racemase domain-containing protein [Desulfobacterales bacterium]